MGRALLCAAVVLGALHVGNGEAHAGGYDTPILYSARHIGMGGTAVGYVGDPSALFHNPAGIAQVERFSVLGDFSLILGDIQAAPANPNGGFGDVGSLRSETTVAPFFLLGAAGRLTDWMTVGVAAYPVASAGAEFNYTSDFDEDFIDRTRLVFFELSAAAAFQIPSYPQLRLGLGYRVTFVSLEREQANQAEGVPPQIDFEASGQNFAGVRIGLQWEAIDDMLQLGLAYRHKTSTTIDGSGFVVGSEFDYVETKFVLPSRLSFGARFDYLDFGVAFDFEYAFQSQNDRADVLVGASSDMTNAVGNIYDWQNGATVRLGLEYRLLEGALPIRAGYIWDQTVSSEAYPTAFGAPAGNGNIFTIGTGYDFGSVEVNVAYAHRRTNGSVTQEDIDGGTLGSCDFCSYPGDYELIMNGVYFDVSFDLESPETGVAGDGEMETMEGGDPDADWETEQLEAAPPPLPPAATAEPVEEEPVEEPEESAAPDAEPEPLEESAEDEEMSEVGEGEDVVAP